MKKREVPAAWRRSRAAPVCRSLGTHTSNRSRRFRARRGTRRSPIRRRARRAIRVKSPPAVAASIRRATRLRLRARPPSRAMGPSPAAETSSPSIIRSIGRTSSVLARGPRPAPRYVLRLAGRETSTHVYRGGRSSVDPILKPESRCVDPRDSALATASRRTSTRAFSPAQRKSPHWKR